MYNCPHLFWKIFVDFLTSTLLRAQKTTLLSKVQHFFFQIMWPSQKTQTLMKHKFPNLLKPLSTINQQNYWSFYPSELIYFTLFNMRHPVVQMNLKATCSLYHINLWKTLAQTATKSDPIKSLATLGGKVRVFSEILSWCF